MQKVGPRRRLLPIRARRIKYFEDPALRVLHAGQAGSFPYPDEEVLRRDRQMTETRETVDKLKHELQEVRAAAGAQGSDANALPKAAQSPPQVPLDTKPAPSGWARGRAARAAAGTARSDQLSFDLAGLGLRTSNGTELVAAVQTTRAIIAEHA